MGREGEYRETGGKISEMVVGGGQKNAGIYSQGGIRERAGGRAGGRAWGFERRLREERGSEWARKCLDEMRERWRRGKTGSKWEEGRREFLEDRGREIEEIEEGSIGEEEWTGKLIRAGKERDRKARWKKIETSKFNRWYKIVKREGIPEYLKKGWGENRWKRVARFRLGSEIKEGWYWKKEEGRKCRLCGGREETWEHMWEECRDWEMGEESWQEVVGWVLREERET